MNITGLPGHPVENMSFSNIHVTFPGGGTAEEAARRDIAEMKDHYPEYHMFGTLPSYGLYARHVRGLSLNNVRFDCSAADMRPAVVCDDAEQLELSGFSAQGYNGQESLIRLCQTKGVFIQGSRALGDVATFVRLEGNESRDILLKNNDLRAAKKPFESALNAPDDAVKDWGG
jgi:hypothetical protein